jgi:hypothetical protein
MDVKKTLSEKCLYYMVTYKQVIRIILYLLHESKLYV